jgi:hypothetical protein
VCSEHDLLTGGEGFEPVLAEKAGVQPHSRSRPPGSGLNPDGESPICVRALA